MIVRCLRYPRGHIYFNTAQDVPDCLTYFDAIEIAVFEMSQMSYMSEVSQILHSLLANISMTISRVFGNPDDETHRGNS